MNQKNKSILKCRVDCGVGREHGRRAVWVNASADQTFVRIDESLINVHTLNTSTVIANQSAIGLSLSLSLFLSVCLCLSLCLSVTVRVLLWVCLFYSVSFDTVSLAALMFSVFVISCFCSTLLQSQMMLYVSVWSLCGLCVCVVSVCVWCLRVWSVCMCGRCVGLVATVSDVSGFSNEHRCLMISRVDGTCRSFTASDQASFIGTSVCLDPVYDNIWRSVSRLFWLTVVSLSLTLLKSWLLLCAVNEKLTELTLDVTLHTKQVISETFLQPVSWRSAKETKPNTTKPNNTRAKPGIERVQACPR